MKWDETKLALVIDLHVVLRMILVCFIDWFYGTESIGGVGMPVTKCGGGIFFRLYLCLAPLQDTTQIFGYVMLQGLLMFLAIIFMLSLSPNLTHLTPLNTSLFRQHILWSCLIVWDKVLSELMACLNWPGFKANYFR